MTEGQENWAPSHLLMPDDTAVRLDRGPVLVGGGADCAVWLEGHEFANVRVLFEYSPEIGGYFKVTDQSSAPSLTVEGNPRRWCILDFQWHMRLGIAPVDRQHRDDFAFIVRYVPRHRQGEKGVVLAPTLVPRP